MWGRRSWSSFSLSRCMRTTHQTWARKKSFDWIDFFFSESISHTEERAYSWPKLNGISREWNWKILLISTWQHGSRRFMSQTHSTLGRLMQWSSRAVFLAQKVVDKENCWLKNVFNIIKLLLPQLAQFEFSCLRSSLLLFFFFAQQRAARQKVPEDRLNCRSWNFSLNSLSRLTRHLLFILCVCLVLVRLLSCLSLSLYSFNTGCLHIFENVINI